MARIDFRTMSTKDAAAEMIARHGGVRAAERKARAQADLARFSPPSEADEHERELFWDRVVTLLEDMEEAE